MMIKKYNNEKEMKTRMSLIDSELIIWVFQAIFACSNLIMHAEFETKNYQPDSL